MRDGSGRLRLPRVLAAHRYPLPRLDGWIVVHLAQPNTRWTQVPRTSTAIPWHGNCPTPVVNPSRPARPGLQPPSTRRPYTQSWPWYAFLLAAGLSVAPLAEAIAALVVSIAGS